MSAVGIGFIVYLVGILIVGILTSRLMKTLPDYLLAGRRLGPWIVAFSERASGESGWMLLGLTGLAYATGLGDPSGTKLGPAMGPIFMVETNNAKRRYRRNDSRLPHSYNLG